MDAELHAPSIEQRIRRLEQETINKIAAAEIIQRPSNAIKELLENALDAKATRVSVVAKEGGLKSLSIQDNGCGIHADDLPLLCERFATSKIIHFDDLRALTSYGFRGEALASISHVSRLTCTTKRQNASFGLKALYSDGKLVPARPGGNAEPKPAAANDGTQILVEDLFFNVPMRRKSLRSGADEYARLLDVVSKYAIHNAGIAVTCKKYASNSLDVNTSITSTVPDNIAHVYGENVKRELVEFSTTRNDAFGFVSRGWCSNVNYSAKRTNFLFFINNRLVDCQALRKAFDAFYSTLLPKGGHPFVYLDLQIDPQKLDVNVHPTKHEVVFEDEEEVVQLVVASLSSTLSAKATSRRFSSQAAAGATALASGVSSRENSDTAAGSDSVKLAPHKTVRTDSRARTLDGMLGFAATQTQSGSKEAVPLRDDDMSNVASKPSSQKTASIQVTKCNLASVQQLRRGIENNVHHELREILSSHTFVGLVGPDRPEALVQHQTKLYMVNYALLGEELFYQLGLRQFGRLGKITLEPTPAIEDLLRLAVSNEAETRAELPLSENHIVLRLASALRGKRAMLSEYFSLDITEDGTLQALPLLLPQFQPSLDRLPLFLLRAALEVEWTSEKECFDTFLRELAFFYAPQPLFPPHLASDGSGPSDDGRPSSLTEEQKWLLQHVLFPAVQRYLVPPIKIVNTTAIKQIASMESLFRVFERC